jgi:hypothetical protein
MLLFQLDNYCLNERVSIPRYILANLRHGI